LTNYRRGARRENEWADRQIADGWSVTRSAGSHGVADVVGCKDGVIVYDQVKATKAGPFSGFGPAERRELLGEATKAGATARLIWWPPDRQGPRVLLPDRWPPTK
jgi:Holliday junction resolvase